MGKRGRFGKYGEKKRIERLRQSRLAPSAVTGKRPKPPNGYVTPCKKTTSQRMHVTTRKARESDASYIGSLSKEVFQEYGPYEKILRYWLDSGKTVTVLALMGEGPAGFAMLSRPAPGCSFSGTCELLAIAVETEKQRLGIGDLLLRDVEKRAVELNAQKIILHTAVRNLDGQKLFRRHGYALAEIKKNFYQGGQDAFMMYKDIS